MSEWSTVHSAPVEYLEGRCSEFPRKCWSRSLRCCRNPHLLHTWSSSYLEHSTVSSARRLLMQLFFGDDSSCVVWSHRPSLMSNVFLHGPLCLEREAGRDCLMYPKIVCLFPPLYETVSVDVPALCLMSEPTTAPISAFSGCHSQPNQDDVIIRTSSQLSLTN